VLGLLLAAVAACTALVLAETTQAAPDHRSANGKPARASVSLVTRSQAVAAAPESYIVRIYRRDARAPARVARAPTPKREPRRKDRP
jgi:hypothetical protein